MLKYNTAVKKTRNDLFFLVPRMLPIRMSTDKQFVYYSLTGHFTIFAPQYPSIAELCKARKLDRRFLRLSAKLSVRRHVSYLAFGHLVHHGILIDVELGRESVLEVDQHGLQLPEPRVPGPLHSLLALVPVARRDLGQVVGTEDPADPVGRARALGQEQLDAPVQGGGRADLLGPGRTPVDGEGVAALKVGVVLKALVLVGCC